MKQGSEAAALHAQATELGAALDDRQLAKLLAYERLLGERAVPMGLVAEGDAGKIRVRHVLDSLRAAAAVSNARDAYDLGSGAGLPGIVLAIARPELSVGLVDSRRRRVAFLELAVTELDVPNATVHGVRAETLTAPVDVCLARAFAPAALAWEVAEPLLRPGGRLVFFAGTGERAEDLRGAPFVEVLRTPVLESSGPLVIMARQ